MIEMAPFSSTLTRRCQRRSHRIVPMRLDTDTIVQVFRCGYGETIQTKDSLTKQSIMQLKRGNSAIGEDENTYRRWRPRTDDDRSHSSRVLKKLTYKDYTVGWICALPLEMTAARAMLDEEHESLPRKRGDDNVYILGSISKHNVVIACLPTGVYGTTSATAVGIAMRTTYPQSISMPLLVGIGGGVPSVKNDIRLGDIAVGVPTSESPAVIQYDRGKTTFDGMWEAKGQLNKPTQVLLSAVAKLRTSHDLGQGQLAVHISTAIEQYGLADYSYPGAELDNLYELSDESDNVSMHVYRLSRPNHDPVVHYGTIGSGNQVVKHGPTRDHIAWPSDIICFEMEAAGLMDWLPCLIVRGICDYCDAQKAKVFQKYSALAAAAYAKDLLSMIPTTLTSHAKLDEVGTSKSQKVSERRKSMMDALNFEEAESRYKTVGKAHTRTCAWFLDHHEFNIWLNPETTDAHSFLLWLKGNPGTGKSTLTKFVLDRQENSKDCVSISFFFNARGHDLEKSTLGMYRSLTYQLLKRVPAMQSLLDSFSSGTTFGESKLGVIQDLFERAVKGLGYKKTLCFIDALDECPEQQIREMIHFFEELGEIVISTRIPFRVFFCSRHYPNISSKLATILILDNQDGHLQDLTRYVDAELEIGTTNRAKQIKQQVLERSAGSFLWAVLTIRILKTEYDKGRLHSLSRKLQDIPSELNRLFRDIVAYDKYRLPELLLCFQLILYAREPMSCKAFYAAMLTGDESAEVSLEDFETVPQPVIDNFILDCSRGLAELTRTTPPVVQFVHESVREFLSQPEALTDLWDGFYNLSRLESHLRLRDCCYRFISQKDHWSWQLVLKDDVSLLAHFFLYAVRNVLYHAEMAEQLQPSQSDFLVKFPHEFWLLNLRGKLFDAIRLLNPDIGFLGALAAQNLYRLLLIYFDYSSPPEADLQALVHLLIKHGYKGNSKRLIEWHRGRNLAYKDSSLDYLDVLLDLSEDAVEVHNDVACRAVISTMFNWLPNIRVLSTSKLAIEFAAEMKRPAALELLLDDDALQSSITFHSLQDPISASPPFFPCRRINHHLDDTTTCMQILFDKGQAAGYRLNPYKMLVTASEWADQSVLRYLLQKCADCDLDSSEKEFILHRAAQINLTRVEALIACDVDVNERDLEGKTALHYTNVGAIARTLLSNGAEIDAVSHDGTTPLHHAAKTSSSLELLPRLLEYGAEENRRDNLGNTPLHYAASDSITATCGMKVDYLIRYGAEVNARNHKMQTALHLAVLNSNLEAIPLLLRSEAEVDALDKHGRSALHTALTLKDSDHSAIICGLLLKHGASITMPPRLEESNQEWADLEDKLARLRVASILNHGKYMADEEN